MIQYLKALSCMASHHLLNTLFFLSFVFSRFALPRLKLFFKKVKLSPTIPSISRTDASTQGFDALHLATGSVVSICFPGASESWETAKNMKEEQNSQHPETTKGEKENLCVSLWQGSTKSDVKMSRSWLGEHKLSIEPTNQKFWLCTKCYRIGTRD